MNKELVFLKGIAKGNKYNELMKSINAAVILHQGQTRKSKEPYIDHPTRVASALYSLGIHEEDILAVAILHDTIEDCKITSRDLIEKYQINENIVRNVILLTKTTVDDDKYYLDIQNNPIALLVKLADRAHNISTMHSFSLEKIEKYIEETERRILPLYKYGVKYYPQYSDQIYYMKYHIESVLNSVKFMYNMLIELRNNAQQLHRDIMNETKRNILNDSFITCYECNGYGYVEDEVTMKTCPVCQGAKIIHRKEE